MRNIRKKNCLACCEPSPTELYKFLPEYVEMICEHEQKLVETVNVKDELNTKLNIQTSNSYFQIGTSIEKRLIHVISDETNLNESTLYFHDGIGLNWITTQKLY